MSYSSTIAAVSTPEAAGGIGIVRISGPDALTVAEKIFIPATGAKISASKGYRAHFGRVTDGQAAIDEAVCLIFRAPHSYTGENTAEISCHGGLYITKAVLRAALANGARLAEPGEFTRRALMNGKLDLAGSEGVMSLISARGKEAAKAALNTLDGMLSKKIHEIADSIVSVCAALAAWVDYPYDEIENTTPEEMLPVFENALKSVNEIIARYDHGRVFTDGIDTAIVGKPNVGKSTLMNMLSGCERSIVTDIAGTTRDVVEQSVRLGGMILHLSDTAGIRTTDNEVESIGVSLAKKRLSRAALVLAVFDASQELSAEDEAIIADCADKRCIAVINKCDLPRRADITAITSRLPNAVYLTASTGEGSEELENAVAELLCAKDFDPENPCLASERQRDCCCRAAGFLSDAVAALRGGVTLDAVTVCADCAVDALLELTGERATEAVVNDVFSRFCVGK